MRIDELQGEIVAHLQLDGDQSFKSLAKKLKIREHRVHYAVSKLMESGTMRRVPRVELSRLGYSYMHIFFSIRYSQRATTKQLLRTLANTSKVVFLAELGGEYHYELIVAVKRPTEISELFTGKLGDLVTHHAISSSRTYEFYPKNYLAPSRPCNSVVTIDHNCDVVTIDEVDKQIFRALLNPECGSLRDAARILSLPFPTVRVRLEKLRNKKVFGGFVYDVEPLDYGYSEFILLVYTRGLGTSMEKELFNSARKNPHITYARSLIGEWNFEVGIEVKNAEDVVQVIEEFTEGLSEEVMSTKLMQRFRALQYRPFPF